MKTAISTWLSSLPTGETPVEAFRRSTPKQPEPPATSARSGLTPRELDVMRLLAGGCTYAQAADRLGVSPHTVVTHIKNTYRKLEVHSAAAAVMRVMELGLFQKASEEPHR